MPPAARLQYHYNIERGEVPYMTVWKPHPEAAQGKTFYPLGSWFVRSNGCPACVDNLDWAVDNKHFYLAAANQEGVLADPLSFNKIYDDEVRRGPEYSKFVGISCHACAPGRLLGPRQALCSTTHCPAHLLHACKQAAGGREQQGRAAPALLPCGISPCLAVGRHSADSCRWRPA